MSSNATCSIDGCGKPLEARGWCAAHYMRWRKYGDPGQAAPLRPKRSPHSTCQVEDCDRKHLARGYCGVHYRLQRQAGALPIVIPKPKRGITTYAAMHKHLRETRGSASRYPCVTCGQPAYEWAYDNECPDEQRDFRGRFSADPSHYLAMCHPCHMALDAAHRRQNA